jgi:hypothetical protein
MTLIRTTMEPLRQIDVSDAELKDHRRRGTLLENPHRATTDEGLMRAALRQTGAIADDEAAPAPAPAPRPRSARRRAPRKASAATPAAAPAKPQRPSRKAAKSAATTDDTGSSAGAESPSTTDAPVTGQTEES